MMKLDEIFDISEKILNHYLNIGDYFLSGDDTDLVKYVEKLKDLLLIEDLAFEKFITQNDRETIYEIVFESDFVNEQKIAEIVYERISEKMYKRLFSANEAANVTMEALKKITNITDNDEEQIRKYVEKEVKQIEFISDEPRVEIARNYITFLKSEIEKEKNLDVRARLASAIVLEIYKNNDIEEELLRKNFKIDDNWIRINNILGLNDDEVLHYNKVLIEFASDEMENTISEALSLNWDVTLKSKYFSTILRCKMRSILYALENRMLDVIKSNILFLVEEHKNENLAGVKIIKAGLTESEEDRIKYPKLLMQTEQSRVLQIESKIYSLYQTLIELEIKRYNGEDVDFDIEMAILNLKVIKEEEDSVFVEDLTKKIKTNPLTGVKSVLFNFDDTNDEIATRTIGKIEKLKNYVALKKYGASEKNARHAIKSSDFVDVYKNILFFLNDAIECANPEDREYLIKQKFDYIYQNIGLEEVAIQTNFQISKNDLIFPDGFFKTGDYDEDLSEFLRKMINTELNGLIFKERENSKELMEFLQKTVAIMRGCLYTFSEEEYENVVYELEESVDKISDQSYTTATAINIAIELSKKDRTLYPKLVL